MTVPVPLPASSSSSKDPSSPPIRTQLLTSLTAQTSLLSSFFTTLAASNPAAAASIIAPAIQSYMEEECTSTSQSTLLSTDNPNPVGLVHLYRSLEVVDSRFAQLVDATYEHQDAWARLVKKKEEAEELERRVRNTIRDLHRDKEELLDAVLEGKKIRKDINQAQDDPISVPTLLSVALNLASTSSAPVSSLLPSQARAHHQAWPTEAVMRAGLLFKTGGTMSGVGDMGKIGDEQDQSTRVVEPSLSQHHHIAHVEERRTHDPDWVMDLDLNSDSDDD